MDTRQLQAFCTVVERGSFSQAAERLGVTQPAVSLQIRALEERLGQRLLDRSGRRVEATNAGRILYRGAQRLLQAEHQLLDELAREEVGELHGRLAIGASTGPGAHLVPLWLCAFRARNPAVTVSLSIFDTHSVINRVVERELELGIVGALRRHRSLAYEEVALDEIVLAVPRGHAFAGREVALDELASETNIVMQEGAGVRQVIEEELREAGIRLRGLPVGIELGLQESVKSAVVAGYGVAFISRAAIEGELAAGTVDVARVAGLEAARPIYAVHSAGRPLSREAEAFLDFARASTATQPA